MATTTSSPPMGTRYQTNDWPAARVLAVVGGVIGLLMALLLLGGGIAGLNVATPVGMPTFAGLTVLAAMGVIHLVLALAILVSCYALLGNMRLHGGLLVLWGLLGLFLGFGFWLGAVLVLAGGILALAATPQSGVAGGRRPAV